MFVKDTIATAKFEVTEDDLNYIGILFGGKLLSELDVSLAQSTYKFTDEKTVTGSVDKVRFIKPLNLGETVTIKSMVSGYNKRTIEVLGQVYNSKNELAAYALMSFIVINKKAELPELIGETEFEKELLKDYPKRAKNATELHGFVQEKLKLEK